MKASNNAKTIFNSGISGYNSMLSQNRAVIDTAIELQYDRGTIESGEIKFILDKSYLNNNSPLYPELNSGLERYSVFIFDESINTICPIPCEYDEENGIISVSASEFMGNLCIIDMESLLYDMGVTASDIMPQVEPMALSLEADTDYESNGNNDNVLINDITEEELESILLGETNTNNMLRSIVVPPQSTIMNQADLVFVIDTTGSMGNAVGTIKSQLASLISKLRKNGITLNVAIVDYKDITCGEKTITHDFSNNIDNINSMLNSIRVTGGGDGPETAVDGLGAAAKLSYSKSSRFIFLITDANSKNNNNYGYSNITDVANALKKKNVYCSVISPSLYNYQPLILNTNGKYIPMSGNFSQDMYDFMLSKANEKKYNVILSSNLRQVTLHEELTYMGLCDSDGDGLTDSEEVNWNMIPKFNADDADEDVVLELPTLEQLTYDKYYSDALMQNPFLKYYLSFKLLPTKSDPSEIDSDGDGFMDSVKNFDSKGYYTDVADKWPLTSTPKNEFYQKDGNYYFNRFILPGVTVKSTKKSTVLLDKNVGFIVSKDSEFSQEYSEELQRYIYEQCTIANKAYYRENNNIIADPLTVLAICAHESGCITTKYLDTGATGLMQFMRDDLPTYLGGDYNSEYTKNPEVKLLIDKACSDLGISQNSQDYIKIVNNSVTADIKRDFALNPKFNLTLGIAKMSEFYRIVVTTDTYNVEKTPYGALVKYCGTINAENEDLYIRNYLAGLIEEERIYEEKYSVS